MAKAIVGGGLVSATSGDAMTIGPRIPVVEDALTVDGKGQPVGAVLGERGQIQHHGSFDARGQLHVVRWMALANGYLWRVEHTITLPAAAARALGFGLALATVEAEKAISVAGAAVAVGCPVIVNGRPTCGRVLPDLAVPLCALDHNHPPPHVIDVRFEFDDDGNPWIPTEGAA